MPCSARAIELLPTLPMPFRTIMRGASVTVAAWSCRRPYSRAVIALGTPRGPSAAHRPFALPFAKRRYHRHPWRRGGASPRADQGRLPMPGEKPESTAQPAEPAPHYHGHRQRLRQRFLAAGSDAVSDYEVLELILFRAIPQKDLKPLAKELIARFGSF